MFLKLGEPEHPMPSTDKIVLEHHLKSRQNSLSNFQYPSLGLKEYQERYASKVDIFQF